MPSHLMECSRKVLLSITPMTPIRCRAPDRIHSDIRLKALSVFTTFKSKHQSLHSPYPVLYPLSLDNDFKNSFRSGGSTCAGVVGTSMMSSLPPTPSFTDFPFPFAP